MGGRGNFGSTGRNTAPVVEPYDINKVAEDYEGLRKFTGTIYDQDLQDYGERYGLPTGDVKMVKVGEWIGAGGRPVGAYVFADGSHPNIQFIRDKKKFYIETIDSY